MTRLRIDQIPQRELAQRLRYWIDREDEENVRALIEENPVSSRSSHVRHNLGLARLRWLRDRGSSL